MPHAHLHVGKAHRFCKGVNSPVEAYVLLNPARNKQKTNKEASKTWLEFLD
jgi:hypothetical protein